MASSCCAIQGLPRSRASLPFSSSPPAAGGASRLQGFPESMCLWPSCVSHLKMPSPTTPLIKILDTPKDQLKCHFPQGKSLMFSFTESFHGKIKQHRKYAQCSQSNISNNIIRDTGSPLPCERSCKWSTGKGGSTRFQCL